MAGKKRSVVDGLKNKLYSRTEKYESHSQERTPLQREEMGVPVTWEDAKRVHDPVDPVTSLSPLAQYNKRRGMSLAAKFFVVSFLFFICMAGAAAYVLFLGGNTISTNNIDIEIVAPSMVDAGKEAPFEILIHNRNQVPLQSADLILQYPDSTRDPKQSTLSLVHDRQSVGVVQAGEQLKRTASALFYGQGGAQQSIKATLEYTIPGSNAVFQKEANASFIIGSSPLSITIDTPSEVISGQQFDFDVTVQSNSSTPLDNILIQGQYPFGFQFDSATPTADAGGTIWRLGSLDVGQSKVIHVSGSVEGQDGDQRVFRFLAGSDADQTDTQVKVPLLSVPQTLVVRKSFISGVIALNNSSAHSVAVSAGTPVNGSITYTNNLPDPVSNVQVVLTLSGPMLDTSAINSSGGFYQSTDNTITWTIPTVAPGASDSLPFTFSTLAPGVGSVVYTNPTVDLNLAITGTRQGQGNVPEHVVSAAKSQARVSSATALTTTALHFTGPFTNSGPMPPVVGQETTYAVVWNVTNSSNSVSNATVSASLPIYVKFLAAQQGSGIVYDVKSRTVTWNLGDIKPGVGYSLPARSAAFQVSLLPSLSQVGASPMLTGKATLVGQDRFSQTSITASASAPDTSLSSADSGFQFGMSQVSPK